MSGSSGSPVLNSESDSVVDDGRNKKNVESGVVKVESETNGGKEVKKNEKETSERNEKKVVESNGEKESRSRMESERNEKMKSGRNEKELIRSESESGNRKDIKNGDENGGYMLSKDKVDEKRNTAEALKYSATENMTESARKPSTLEAAKVLSAVQSAVAAAEMQLDSEKHHSQGENRRDSNQLFDEKHEWSEPVFYMFGVVAVPPWVFGVALGIIGYSLCGLGMNLIRLSHLVYGVNQSISAHNQLRETMFNRKGSRARSRVVWVMGYGFNTLGGTLNVMGLRYAAQSLMAPLSSMALVSNAVFATSLLGERIQIEKDLLPMSMIAVGNVVTVLSADHKGFKQLSIEQFDHLFHRKPFQMYIVVVLILVFVLVLLRERYSLQVKRSGGRELASQLLVAKVGLFHAAAGCIFCVHCVFLSKASMLILAEGIENLRNPSLLLVVGGWLGLGMLWIYTLNRLLGEYDALFIVPVIEVVWSLQSMIGGGIFFNEFNAISNVRLMTFVLGVVINISGVWFLSRRHDRRVKTAE